MIAFNALGKSYRGWWGREVRALTDFTLEIPQGEVFGLAGPNGAGKSTLIALLLGFLSPTEGETRIDGRDPREFVERNGVGYLSELMTINPSWTAESALAPDSYAPVIPSGSVAGLLSCPSQRSHPRALRSSARTHVGVPLPKRNFGFEKRQKELEKQRKRAEKLLRRSERAAGAGAEPDAEPAADGEVDPTPQADGQPAE